MRRRDLRRGVIGLGDERGAFTWLGVSQRGMAMGRMSTDRFMWAVTATTAGEEKGKHELKCEPA